MNHGIYSAASAMDAARLRLDRIAHNVANLGTPAFKRQDASFASIQTTDSDGLHRVVAGMPRVDLSQGNLMRTGGQYDLALMGEGFFAVELPGGEAYTRRGAFDVGPGGTLLTGEGYPLAWELRTGAIDPLGEPVLVNRDGVVQQGAVEVGRLRLVNFADNHQLKTDREGYLHAPPGLPQAARTAEVHQYSLEGSNVNPIEEMVALIETQRAFEGAANALSLIEESYRRLSEGR